MSSDFFRQNVGKIYLTLRLTLWEDCEKNVSGDEYPMYLPPTLWAEFLSQCEDISLSIWFSGPDCDSHVKGKTKICSTFSVDFISNFELGWFIQSSFLFSFQKCKFFWNRTKIDVFTVIFPWYYFLCGRIPSFWENDYQNVKILCEEFRCHLILWVTMWAEFFSHCD